MQNQALTVSQLTYTIKNLLENQKMFQGFVLKGEISNFTKHRTGHLYFALKDENASIRAIMFSSYANGLKFQPKDGDKVTVTGSISLYAPQGSYSVSVTSMQIDGAGELYLKYLELKEKLKNLGWFDKPKKELPKYPKNIGVITSATGAVIEDITNTVNRRYRLTNIILYPALVQGAGAASSISKQIEKANKDNICDVLIVGRGGGSIEDLWGFNELLTISAIYNSKIPIITAIGHETDDTISDLVSDLRAPTPTAAAELATPDSLELIKNLNDNVNNINFKIKNYLHNKQNSLMYLEERLESLGPKKRLENYHNRLDSLNQLLKTYFNQKISNELNILKTTTAKLNGYSPKNKVLTNLKDLEQIKVILNKNYNYLIENNFKNINNVNKDLISNYLNLYNLKSNKLTHVIDVLKKVNPLSIMERGFTIIKNEDNKVLTSISEISLEEKVSINFKDGIALAKVISKGDN